MRYYDRSGGNAHRLARARKLALIQSILGAFNESLLALCEPDVLERGRTD
jgi:hypothetical protein